MPTNLGGDLQITTTQKKTRLNTEIRAVQVRLIDENNQQCGVVAREEALQLAERAALDLVEIAPNADPPVCRIMDYGKYLYEQMKKKSKKQKSLDTKELKYRPGIGEQDYLNKLRNLIRFLEEGHKVKVTIRFRGREYTHQDLGLRLIERLKLDLSERAQIEQEPKMENRQIVMVVAPRRDSVAKV